MGTLKSVVARVKELQEEARKDRKEVRMQLGELRDHVRCLEHGHKWKPGKLVVTSEERRSLGLHSRTSVTYWVKFWTAHRSCQRCGHTETKKFKLRQGKRMAKWIHGK